MFTVSDYRQTNMPVLATVTSAEAGYEFAERNGFRESACVLPRVKETPTYGGPDSTHETAAWLDGRRAFTALYEPKTGAPAESQKPAQLDLELSTEAA